MPWARNSIAARSSASSAMFARSRSIARPTPNSTTRRAECDDGVGHRHVADRQDRSAAGGSIAAIRSAVRDINPTLAVFNVKTMDQVVTDSMWQLNLYRWLIGLFAGLALVLAAVGLYGVISFGAASRLREFAVRLALGSGPGQLIQLVVARGLILAICGIAAGFVAASSVSPSARAVSPALAIEPSTSLAVAVLLIVVALVARHFQRFVQPESIPQRAAPRLTPRAIPGSAGFY